MADRCLGTTKDGKPCGAKPLPGSQLCPWHDPAWAERRKEWSVRGGKGKANKARAKKALPVDPMTDAEVLAWLGVVFTRTIAGAMPPGVATAAAAAAKAMVAVRQASEWEARLAELERRAGLADRRFG
jgi:hypothetical protein